MFVVHDTCHAIEETRHQRSERACMPLAQRFRKQAELDFASTVARPLLSQRLSPCWAPDMSRLPTSITSQQQADSHSTCMTCAKLLAFHAVKHHTWGNQTVDSSTPRRHFCRRNSGCTFCSAHAARVAFGKI
eukprot:GHRQ01006998.1.p1 GENE.GHRQ01006998.1~~GHRQ01006998.1.p1  ORF type:complete len:132 (-),score=2.80 GHRQ01006998.1:193-588(-)